MQNLIKKAKKGDDQAYWTLFQMHQAEIYRMAFIYVKNENDALDVVQETAYRSFKTIKGLKETKYFKTWLIKITINCSLDLLRKRKKFIPFKPEMEENLFAEENEDLDLEITLRDLMENLTPEEKSVILLRFYQSFTFKEISEVLHIPLGTAKTVLYRALKKLRKSWKGEAVDE